jgi:hypothetical protein
MAEGSVAKTDKRNPIAAAGSASAKSPAMLARRFSSFSLSSATARVRSAGGNFFARESKSLAASLCLLGEEAV